MSLIDPKNLIAPFKNKIAVGSIVVICIIVAVARISSSNGSRAQTRDNDTTERNRKVQEYLADNGDELEKLNQPSRKNDASEVAPIEDDYLTGLLEEELTQKRPSVPSKVDNKNGGLTDIKKSLGLE